MTEGYYERIAGWLSKYFRIGSGPVPPDPQYIRAALAAMIASGYTVEQIKRRAIMEDSVIIRDDLFPMEAS